MSRGRVCHSVRAALGVRVQPQYPGDARAVSHLRLPQGLVHKLLDGAGGPCA